MSKKYIITVNTMLMAACMLAPITVHAESSSSSDGTAEVAVIEEKMNNIKKNSGLSQDDVNSAFSDTMKQFSDLSSSYTKLSDNYGNVNTANTGDYYLDYLENLRDSNEQTQYDDKLYAIQNSDISINDATLSSTYTSLKKSVKKNLSAAGLNVKDITSSKNKSTAKKNTANRDTLLSFSDASAKYEELVDDYKSMLTSEDDDGNTIKNPYAEKNKSSLTSSLGKTISKSYYDGDTYTGGKFMSTSEIFSKISNKADSILSGGNSNNSDSDNTEQDNSNKNTEYSSITEGIGNKN